MPPRKLNLTIPESTELVDRGRQALMSHISNEFQILVTITEFLIVRNSPRMASTESAGRSN